MLLEHCINAPVECDGFVRLAHTALVNSGIEHTVLMGRLTSQDESTKTPIHFWIVLEDGSHVDFRARLWLGDSADIPHGIFHTDSYPHWKYVGEKVEIAVLPPVLVRVLLQANAYW
jgi:hypothetical protein